MEKLGSVVMMPFLQDVIQLRSPPAAWHIRKTRFEIVSQSPGSPATNQMVFFMWRVSNTCTLGPLCTEATPVGWLVFL